LSSIAGNINRWLDVLHGRESYNFRNGSNVWASGRTLYSYGTHFPLAEFYGRRDGTTRERPLFLLNGDRFSVSTSRHQSETRGAIENRAGEFFADIILLPFSALDGAGILRETIRPLEVRADEWINADRYAATLDDVPQWIQSRAEYEPGTLDELENGTYRYTVREHRLGESLFTAAVQVTRRRRRDVTVRDVVRAAVNDIRRRPEGSALAELGETIAETETARVRHRYVSSFDRNEPAPLYFLATLPSTSRAHSVAAAIEDLAPAAVHAAMLRGADVLRQGDIFAIPTNATDADMAERARLTLVTRDARAREHEPGYVAPLRAADRRELVKRAARLWRKEWRASAGMTLRGQPLQPKTARGARRSFAEFSRERERDIRLARDMARRAILRGELETPRWNEPGRYTVRGLGTARYRERDAAERRHRQSNAYSRAASRDVYRRGGIGIQPGTNALTLWRECVTAAYHELRPAAKPDRQETARRHARALLAVHGTAHSATEVARGPGGAIYVRGVMRHVPELEPGRFGGRDHVNLALGDGHTWYLAVRNTVPRVRGGGRDSR